MKHTPQGWWLEEVGARAPAPPLEGQVDCDVLIVGGGFTGLWTAWQLARQDPGLRIVCLERDRFGHGPSGRNGGFAMTLWPSLATMAERFGADGALAMARASEGSLDEIEQFCRDLPDDAWFRMGGYMMVSTAPGQDASWHHAVEACRELGAPEAARELEPGEVAERCRSPLFRGGAFFPASATVQPARLARGLFDAASALPGVTLHEHSPVTRFTAGAWGCEASTASGRVRARSGVLAMGAALAGSRSPLHGKLTVASSHIALTEPVPDLLSEIGWTGGESITDGRRLVHYFRTTADDRIAFGWGGGEIALDGRIGGRAEVDRDVIDRVVADLLRTFPGLSGRSVTHAWGGPIDASPSHLPTVSRIGSDPVWAAFGYTGNGVGPSHMVGKVLASLVLGRDDEYSTLPLVDSGPRGIPAGLAGWAGGNVIRGALLRAEAAEADGETPALADRLISQVPELIGFHIGR